MVQGEPGPTDFAARHSLSLDVRAELAKLAEERAAEKLAANWQAHYSKLDRPRQAWADLLMREPWHWFVTLTFRIKHEGRGGGIHPEKASKAWHLFVNSINEELYGRRWRKKRGDQGGIVWALGEEFHKDGRIHFHALASCTEGDLSAFTRRLAWMDWWYREFGIARIYPPDSQDDVCGYVSKYVVKGGEVDFSSNFGKARVPSLWTNLSS